jgi:hypothetical protein
MDLSEDQINLLSMGISHYTGVLISSKIITELINKIIKRFKS